MRDRAKLREGEVVCESVVEFLAQALESGLVQADPCDCTDLTAGLNPFNLVFYPCVSAKI